jgi:hypothetical protein
LAHGRSTRKSRPDAVPGVYTQAVPGFMPTVIGAAELPVRIRCVGCDAVSVVTLELVTPLLLAVSAPS